MSITICYPRLCEPLSVLWLRSSPSTEKHSHHLSTPSSVWDPSYLHHCLLSIPPLIQLQSSPPKYSNTSLSSLWFFFFVPSIRPRTAAEELIPPTGSTAPTRSPPSTSTNSETTRSSSTTGSDSTRPSQTGSVPLKVVGQLSLGELPVSSGRSSTRTGRIRRWLIWSLSRTVWSAVTCKSAGERTQFRPSKEGVMEW